MRKEGATPRRASAAVVQLQTVIRPLSPLAAPLPDPLSPRAARPSPAAEAVASWSSRRRLS
ncbi:hypothetical protein ACFTXM_17835 [Streptomyces sp. NPDC056930]|uniref:hypothetical protein n=1 Tax=Streptomyces sp. NPDC056930 TaxID=3345967 RepID=UPI00362B1CE4